MKDSFYYYSLGMDQFEKGEIKISLIYFLSSLALGPHFKTYERLYEILHREGLIEEAFIMIQKAYELNSNNDKTGFLYAKTLIERHEINEARKVLNNLLHRNGSYLPAKKMLDELKTPD